MTVRWQGLAAICAFAALISGSVMAQEPRKLLDVMRVTTEGDASTALVTPVKGPVRAFFRTTLWSSTTGMASC